MKVPAQARGLRRFLLDAVLIALPAMLLGLRSRGRLRECPAVVGLVPLQGREVQALGLQWAEQGVNTVGQLGFLLGTWRLWIKVRALPSFEAVASTTPAP